MRRWISIRIAAVAAGAVIVVGGAAAPASAHTIGGPRPTNYRSRVVAIAPEVPGISARTVDLGSKLELTNRTSTEITVLGYEGEPYLRIGPGGVFENLRSQATYINRTRAGGSVPPGVDTSPTAPPEWKKIGTGHTARWHDHRIHWMGAQDPPVVAASPGTFHHLSQPNVVFLRNGERVAIAVSLDWVPGPSGLPWIPVLAVLFAAGLVAVLVPRWWRTLAVLVGVLVVCDVAHAIAFEIPRPGTNGAKLVQFVATSFVALAVWIAAVPTILALVRRRVEALYGVVFVAILVALVGGATDLSTLWKSQLPDAGPGWLTRLEVVIALGLGSGLAVGTLVRMIRSRTPAPAEERGSWLSLLVSGLSDAELARILPELDADEVLDVAMRELATRAASLADAFAAGSLAFVVTDEPGPMTWSLTAASGTAGLEAVRGRVEPTAASLHASFAVMLRLLAGSMRVDDAIERALVTVEGDADLVDRLAPYVAEAGAVTPSDGPSSAV